MHSQITLTLKLPFLILSGEFDLFLGFSWRDWSATIIPGSLFSIGIEEDRIDKPDRPIPSGKITIAGAQLRRALALAAFLSVAAYEPALWPETFCWVIIVVLHLAMPSAFGNHWFVENCVALGTGTWALLGASWKAIASLTPRIEGYILAVSVWAGLMTHIQDLRDMKCWLYYPKLFVLNASQNYTYTFCLDWKAKPHAVVGQLKRFRIV
ncbi:hypothetical protein L218DRAFT_1063068 [Marasmius fiardii PR-910]|nr:hypothetical protein L218DRAFT_1063068 [Marasmius fiardii PR-910]